MFSGAVSYAMILATTPASSDALLTVSRPSVTTVADGLVARGLVERVHDTQDRRRVNHALTADGRALLHHADEVIESGLGSVLGHLDPSGARAIAAGFGSLQALIERIIDEHGETR